MTTSLEIFTTRVDTIYGASAIVFRPPIASETLLPACRDGKKWKRSGKLRQRILRGAELATAEKEGFFTGRFAINPFSGESMPIWVANFVLAEYGTGAVMAVPAHDQRDFEFAEKYDMPFHIVVQPVEGAPLRLDRMNEAFTEYGRLVDSGPYTGLTSEQAIEKMTADAKAQGFGDPRNDLSPEGLGHFAAALLGHSDPGDLLPDMTASFPCRMINCRCACRKT